MKLTSGQVTAAIVAVLVFFSTVRAYGHPEPPSRVMADSFCIEIPHMFESRAHHRLVGVHCNLVRFDRSAEEYLFAVWVADVGPKLSRLYFACLWQSGMPETAPIRVNKVGRTHGVLC